MTRTRVLVLGLIVSLTFSGCSGYHIVKPDYAPPPGQKETPLPLVAGLKIVNQKFSGGFSDMGPAFASRLTNAGLFKTVFYPIRSDDKLDLMIEANFEGRFVPDSSLFAKAFLTGLLLFLPAPVVEYEHHYKATASVQTTQGGRQLKAYTADSDIAAQMKIFAPPMEVEKDGVAAATNYLFDQIVTQLLNDRALFSGLQPGNP